MSRSLRVYQFTKSDNYEYAIRLTPDVKHSGILSDTLCCEGVYAAAHIPDDISAHSILTSLSQNN